jgi:Mce-associated membrane protein
MSRLSDRRGAVAVWAALVLAVLFCAFAGWSYGQTKADDSLAYAASRDRAIEDGRAHIARLTSFDAKDPDTGLRQWLDASTGPLHDELKRTKAKTDTTVRATVTDAALTALDTRTGTAELIATVRVETGAGGAKAGSTDRKRLEATLARTADGWKVKSLSAVPVGGA